MKLKSDITCWGPSTWTFLHAVALSFPVDPTRKEKENYQDFFNKLHTVLPCSKCANNLQKKLELHPVNVEDKKSLNRWLFDVHNMVNESCNKPQKDYAKFISEYIHPNQYHSMSLTDEEHQRALMYLNDELEGPPETSVTDTCNCEIPYYIYIIITILALLCLLFLALFILMRSKS